VSLKSNAKASGKNEAKMNTNLESKSLAQNKELIALFYTAM
jgi:hypothetical protein